MTNSAPKGRIKGVSFVSARRFVERGGTGAWAKVVAAMPEELGRMADEALAVGWYATEVYTSLLHAIDHQMGDGSLSTMAPLARFQATHDLNLFYRMVLRFWSPAIVVDKTAEMWSRYHDTGVWVVERDGNNRVVASVSEWLGASDAMCAGTVAYIGRLFELVGAKSARVAHPECLARGARRCQWVVEWE